MENSYRNHLIESTTTISDALKQLNTLGIDAILFVVDKNHKLIGSLTDGDIRRGLIQGIGVDKYVTDIIQSHPKFIRKGEDNIQNMISYREKNYLILPVIDDEDRVINIINFKKKRAFLPVDVVVMAGGYGKRLKPLTDSTPKPLLKIGDKPIIEHNIDRLSLYGINNFWITVKYLGEQIVDFLGNGDKKNISIKYINEVEPLGTIGAVSMIHRFDHNYVLVTNSDILTNLDYEQFYLDFYKSKADFAVVSIPYDVNIPYAVLETDGQEIKSFKEKPTYTYYSNGGIYLMKKEILELIPKNTFYNTTDLMEKVISIGAKIISFPLIGYWLDIGKHEDFKKAQQDISHIKF